MPYIEQKRRDAIELGGEPDSAGELNYVITRIVHDYANRHKGYQGFNDVMGALEGVKLEMYRRRIAPYEDTKIKENGDVGWEPAPSFRELQASHRDLPEPDWTHTVL